MNTTTEAHLDHHRSIAALFRGRLATADREALHQHLSDCQDCRRVYERYAAAERALSPQAEISPLALDRVAARLLGAPPAAPARSKAPLWAALATAGGLAVLVLVPKPASELTARSGGERVTAQVGLRALGLSGGSEALAVHDLETTSAQVGERLQLLATSFDRARWGRAWVRLSDGRVLPLGAAVQLEAGVEDQTLSSVEVPSEWPAGPLELIVVYAKSAAALDLTPNEQQAVDGPERSVRLVRTRLGEDLK